MRKYKDKIITAVLIAALLVVAWVYGGRHAGETENADRLTAPEILSVLSGDEAFSRDSESRQDSANTPDAQTESNPGDSAAAQTETDPANPQPLPDGNEQTESQTETPADEISQAEPGKHQADAIPGGQPAPVEPQDAAVTDESLTVTLSVRCDTLLVNMNLLDKEKHELVPADGIIFPPTAVTAYAGESVFNVLQREMKRNQIHLAFRNTPIYNSAFIESINNLYEYDAGALSGWMYQVNGWFPNYGCSRYSLKDGDVIEWRYTCDLGKDIGGGNAAEGQRDDRQD